MLAMVTACTQVFAYNPGFLHGASALAVTNLCIVGCLLNSNTSLVYSILYLINNNYTRLLKIS